MTLSDLTPALPAFSADDAFWEIKRLAIARTGHFYYQNKDDLFWERVRRRMRAAGAADTAAYLQVLNDPSSAAEWMALEADLTIGETFFFRYAEQFAALKNTILPDILARNRATRRIRIWSAGCASGAEPYSVAILLRELLGPALDDWKVSILGTDINDTVLHAARRAHFGRWALRVVNADQRGQYFTALSDSMWALKPKYRAMVRFERQNLMTLLNDTAALQLTDFDLVLCRNVLIYFHLDAATRVVSELARRLSPDGWLLLGHADPQPLSRETLTPVQLPGTVAYRRGEIPERIFENAPLPVEGAAPLWSPNIPPPLPVRKSAVPRRNAPSYMPAPPVPVFSARRPSKGTAISEVRARADLGDYEGALILCRQMIASDPLSAVLHFYEGLLLHALDRLSEAETSLRSALYLDKNFAMAHHTLGLVLMASGKTAAGRRALANAARVAGQQPDSDVLAEGDGLTAAGLQDMVRYRLEGTQTRPEKGAR